LISIEKKYQLGGHRGSVYAIKKCTANSFFTAGSDGIVVKWNFENISEAVAIAKVEGQVFSMCFVNKKNQLWIGTMQGMIFIIDLNQKKEIHAIDLKGESVFDLKSKNGFIYAALKSGEIFLFDENDFTLQKKHKVSEQSIRCIDFQLKKNEIAFGSSDNSVYILNEKTFEIKNKIQPADNSIFCLSYSPDGKYLITGSRDAHLYVFEANEKYNLLQKIPAHLFTINSIQFILNGKYFASASRDRTIKIWETENFKLLKVLDVKYAAHLNSVNKLLWMEEEKTLVSAGDDRSIILWLIKDNE
jgi:WD40 repeat protein